MQFIYNTKGISGCIPFVSRQETEPIYMQFETVQAHYRRKVFHQVTTLTPAKSNPIKTLLTWHEESSAPTIAWLFDHSNLFGQLAFVGLDLE